MFSWQSRFWSFRVLVGRPALSRGGGARGPTLHSWQQLAWQQRQLGLRAGLLLLLLLHWMQGPTQHHQQVAGLLLAKVLLRQQLLQQQVRSKGVVLAGNYP